MDSQDFDRFGYIWYALVLIDTKSVAFVTRALVVILEALIPYPSPKGIFCSGHFLFLLLKFAAIPLRMLFEFEAFVLVFL